MVLCFGIAVLAQCQTLFCFSHHLMSEGAGDPQEVVGRHGWNSRLQVTEGIFHIIWHNVQYMKLGEKEEMGDVWNDSLCSQITATNDGSLISWGWMTTYLSVGCSE